MSDDTIKEFLVGIGFEVNTQQEKRFTDSIRSATLQAKLLGDAIEGMLKKLVSMTSRAADMFDQMFYASSRIGASVENIRTFEGAVSMLGGSVEEARAGLENMGRFLRVNPGGYNFLSSLGVNLKNANGELKQTDELLESLVKSVSNRPYGVQMKIAEMLGIPENTWRAAMSGDMASLKARTKQIYSAIGIDFSGAARDGKEFANSLRMVDITLRAIGEKVLRSLFPGGKDGLDGLQKFLEEHGKEIADSLSKIALAVMGLITHLGSLVTEENVNKAITVLSDFARGVQTAVRWTKDLVTEITNLIAALDNLGKRTGMTKWLGRIMGFHDDELDIPKEEQTYKDKSFSQDPWFKRLWNGAKSLFSPSSASGGGAHLGDAAGRGHLSQNQRTAYQAATDAGLNDSMARVLVANLTGEGLHVPRDRHWDGTHYSQGIAQWDPQRSAAIAGQFGAEPRNLSVTDQVKAVLWEIRTNPRFAETKRAMESGNPSAFLTSLVRNFEVPANVAGAIAKRAGIYKNLPSLAAPKESHIEALKKVVAPSAHAPSAPWGGLDPDTLRKRFSAPPAIAPQAWNNGNEINQTIHNTIYGANDASSTGSEINLAHARANRQLASLIRNTNGAAA